MLMDISTIPGALDVLSYLWPYFFPKDRMYKNDPRLDNISMLFSIADQLVEEAGGGSDRPKIRLIDAVASAGGSSVAIDFLGKVASRVPIEGFDAVIRQQPHEVIGCMGLAFSLKVYLDSGAAGRPVPIWPSVYNVPHSAVPFHEIRSGIVGNLVTLRGYVVRVTACRPLVLAACFRCAKCGMQTRVHFEDGAFTPPAQCATPKCYNKYLEFDRSSIESSDYQRVKLQELEDTAAANDNDDDDNSGTLRGASGGNGDDVDAGYFDPYDAVLDPDARAIGDARQPGNKKARTGRDTNTAPSQSTSSAASVSSSRSARTVDVELRGAHLLDLCAAGDVVVCTGELKMMQMDAPRGGGGGFGKRAGGGHESALHQLYVLASSLHKDKKRARSVYNSTTDDDQYDKSSLVRTKNTSGSIIEALPLSKLPRGIPIASAAAAAGDFSDVELDWIRRIAGTRLRLSPSFSSSVPCTMPWLVSSLCPLIYGHELVKLGLILALFGGTQSATRYLDSIDLPHSSGALGGVDAMEADGYAFSTRCDIHVLIVGDPGLGKSQLLRAAAAVAPKSVFVCANTATTAGLTVSLSRDGAGMGRGGGGGGRDVCIEAGALVLADRGVCCIDEIDKMTCDPHSMLEAMEQQQISVAKSGMVTSLKSRTTILAAANPVGGHYTRNKSASENIKMASALLSRFDLLFILLDRADEDRDRLISEHVMGIRRAGNSMHSTSSGTGSSSGGAFMLSFNDDDGNAIEQDVPASSDATLSQRLRRECALCAESQLPLLDHAYFRKYIEFAKTRVFPRLTPQAAKVLQRMYLSMRSKGIIGGGTGGDELPVTTRHLESLIRLAQARARMELRDEVTEADANDVVDLLNESILDTATSDAGVVDFGRKGGMSLAKQVKALVAALTRSAATRGSTVFTLRDITDVYTALRMPPLGSSKGKGGGAMASRLASLTAGPETVAMDVSTLVDVMRSECYLTLKGPKLYQLQTF